MHSIQEIIDLETRHSNERPTLQKALELLIERFDSGARDKETLLHIAFLSWFSCADFSEQSGLSDNYDHSSFNFSAAYNALNERYPEDPDVLFSVGFMLLFKPYCAGPTDQMTNLGIKLFSKAKNLGPLAITPDIFSNRGSFGIYFKDILESRALERSLNHISSFIDNH